MSNTIARRDRAWHSDMYRADAQHDAIGWEQDEDIYGETCPCGSGLPADDEDGGCVACWFARVYRVPA